MLASYSFDADPGQGAPPGEEAIAVFVESRPWAAGAARIEVISGTATLAERAVTSHAPTVAFESPRGGEIMSGTVPVRWTASDADDPHAELAYLLFYSPDAGQTWTPLAVDWLTDTMNLDATSLPGAEQARLRVVASDGVNTGEAVSGVFRVVREPPLPIILLPEDQAVYAANEPPDLRGSAWDEEDGSLTDAALTWTDSISGTLGAGSTLFAQALTPGWHTLTLTAVDSDGMTGADRVRVCVGCTAAYLPLILR